MDLVKSMEFFNPTELHAPIHIIGCGSVGSTLAIELAHYGIEDFRLYDMDIIEPHNIVNTVYNGKQIGMMKTSALKQMILDINDRANVVEYDEGYTDQPLSGYVFLAVDSINLRREILKKNKFNGLIKAVFDIRTSLKSAQFFAADWSKKDERDQIIGTMGFDDSSVKVEASACGVHLGVASTVRMVCTAQCANFMNLYHKEKYILIGEVYPFECAIEAIVRSK